MEVPGRKAARIRMVEPVQVAAIPDLSF